MIQKALMSENEIYSHTYYKRLNSTIFIYLYSVFPDSMLDTFNYLTSLGFYERWG